MTDPVESRASAEVEESLLIAELLKGVDLDPMLMLRARTIVNADVRARREIVFDRNEPFSAWNRAIALMEVRNSSLKALLQDHAQLPAFLSNAERQRSELDGLHPAAKR